MSVSMSDDTAVLGSCASLFGLKGHTLAFPSSGPQDRRQVPGLTLVRFRLPPPQEDRSFRAEIMTFREPGPSRLHFGVA